MNFANVAIPTRMANVTFVPLATGALIARRVPAAQEPELVPATVYVPPVYLAMVRVLATSTKRRRGCCRNTYRDIRAIVKIVLLQMATHARATSALPIFGAMDAGAVTTQI